MKQSDFNRFSEILAGVFEIYTPGKDRSAVAGAIWWKLLQRFEFSAVEAALAEHVGASKFAPTPADIITILTSRDGRPTADEAWSMIPRSEDDSVMWTDEMARAYGMAAPLLERGDPIAARRAFIDRYESEVAAARRAGTPINVTPSWGRDAAGRGPALTRAMEVGMLSQASAAKYAVQLPVLAFTDPKISGLINQPGSQIKRIN